MRLTAHCLRTTLTGEGMDSAAISSLIAAGSALAGGAIAQMFSLLAKRSERKHETHLLRRAKLEELTELVNQSRLAGLEALALARRIPGKESVSTAQQAQDQVALRVCSLALLFFPSLRVLADDFLKASVNFQIALESGKEDEMIDAAQRVTKIRKAMEQEIERCAIKLGFHG